MINKISQKYATILFNNNIINSIGKTPTNHINICKN